MNILYFLAILVVGCALSFGSGYVTAYSGCATKAEVTSLKSKLAAAEADKNVAARAAAEDKQKLQDLEIQAKGNRELVDEITDYLTQDDRLVCDLTDADAERLRNIK